MAMSSTMPATEANEDEDEEDPPPPPEDDAAGVAEDPPQEARMNVVVSISSFLIL